MCVADGGMWGTGGCAPPPQIRTSAAAEMEALANTMFELGVMKVGVLVTISPKDSLPSQFFEQFTFFANPLGIKIMSVASLNIDSWLTDFTLDGIPAPSPLSLFCHSTRSLSSACGTHRVGVTAASASHPAAVAALATCARDTPSPPCFTLTGCSPCRGPYDHQSY